jgi:hypothetical protein
MHRLFGDSIKVGFVILSLLRSSAVHAKPWRNIGSIPVSRIKWMGLSSTDGDGRTHLYSWISRLKHPHLSH